MKRIKLNKNQFPPQALYLIAASRIGLGWIFLWSFLDKLWGLGFATCRDSATDIVNQGCASAWINGGSPTSGFLQYGTSGPLAENFAALAGSTWADWLFMMGLLLIGLALILGIGVRVATISASLLLALMYLAALPPPNNPFLDDHLIYILMLALIAVTNGSQRFGFGPWWQKQPLVKRYSILR
ncbi:MAG: hypothetical protein WD467_00680 [Candidatus Saccharimonadales bacterium]